VHELDEAQAANIGLIEGRPAKFETGFTILDGIKSYEKHFSRPQVRGGVQRSTQKRYRRILNNIENFAAAENLNWCSQIGIAEFDKYVEHLENREFRHTTIVTELTLFKAMHSYWIDQKKLAAEFTIKYPLKRQQESFTFCPSGEQVLAILNRSDTPELTWLNQVVMVLSHTGVRLGEGAGIRWSDITPDFDFMFVRDESYLDVPEHSRRKTKTGYSRKIPISTELAKMLRGMERHNGKLLSGPRGGTLRSDTFGRVLQQTIIPDIADEYTIADLSRLTAHGFRHYFVSRCANGGVPQMSVMNWLGHRTPRMTNYYYHSNDTASLNHMRQLEQVELSGNVNPTKVTSPPKETAADSQHEQSDD
jgi:integrase